MLRLQRGKRHTVENGSGAEDNGDSSHCSNASVHSNQVCLPAGKLAVNHHTGVSTESCSDEFKFCSLDRSTEIVMSESRKL